MSKKISLLIEQLREFPLNVNRLFPGASLTDIQRAEKVLNTSFSEEYQQFLMQCNGGSLFDDSIVICGVPVEPQGNLPDLYDLVKQNISKSVIPEEYLIIATYSYGDAICLKSTDDDIDGISCWNHETGKQEETWNSLSDWLSYELKLKQG